MTATQTETLRTIRTLVDANGGTTKLSRKPVKLIALGLVIQTRVGQSGLAGLKSRYALTPAGYAAC
jgi:hypothetical protein